MKGLRILNSGEWSKPPVLTAARRILVNGLGEHFKKRSLGESASFLNETSYDVDQVNEFAAAPIIRISNITDPSSDYVRTNQQLDKKFWVMPGDLLVSWSASFKSTIWPGPQGFLNQHIFKVTEREGFDRRYIRHAIEASFDEMQENVVGIGMMHLRRADFLGHPIPAPPFKAQEAVADYLDFIESCGKGKRPALPQVLETQQRLVERIEELAAQIHEARTLRRQAAEEAEALLIAMAHRADLDAQVKETMGWRQTRLKDVIQLVDDAYDVEPQRSYPNLGIYSFGRGLFHKPPINGVATSAKSLRRVKAGQFIYSRLFAFEGSYGMVTPEFDGAFVSQEYPTFECDPKSVRAEFLVAYFKPPHVWKTVAEGSKGLGDRRQRVQPERILSHEIWLPPIKWQNRMADVKSQTDALKYLQAETAAELDALLPSILDKAFKGEL